MNKTLSALFNAAYGVSALNAAVFACTTEVSRNEANLAIGAGLLAFDKGYRLNKAQERKDWLIDQVAAILDKKISERSDTEQKLYLRINTKYLYYFGSGKSSKDAVLKAKSAGHGERNIGAMATAAVKKINNKREFDAYIAACIAKWNETH